jgi:glycosyltransferase involved in cell wall biosynthesis
MTYRVHFWQADQEGPGWLRVAQVHHYLNQLCGAEFTATVNNYMNPNEWITTDASGVSKPVFDLTIHQRQYGDSQLQYFRMLQNQLKVPCVYEIDDYLHGISPLSPAYHIYHHPHKKKNLFTNLNAYLQEATALTVSTDYLKKLYTKFNRNIYVLPNCIDYAIFTVDNTQKITHGDEIWIGWAGSYTHVPDIQIIVEPIRKILRDFPQTKLVIGGWNGRYTTPSGRQFYLWEAIPANRLITLPWTNNKYEYPKMLAQFDIGLAPLADIPFNRCKSNIKYLEYVTCGVPVIASDVEPYTKTIKDGQTGILVTTDKQKVAKSWYEAIKTLILDESLRRTLADNGKNFARQNFDIAVRIYEWKEVYQEIIERFRK